MDGQVLAEEYDQIKLRLRQIADQSTHPNVARMAIHALDFLQAEDAQGSPAKSGWMTRWRAQLAAAQARWLTSTNLKIAVIMGLIVLGLRGVLAIATILLVSAIADPARWQELALTPVPYGEPFGTTRLLLVVIALTLESVGGGRSETIQK